MPLRAGNYLLVGGRPVQSRKTSYWHSFLFEQYSVIATVCH
jgi:hypothetical protein